MTEKDQSVNNTEEEVNSEENVETQNVDNSQDSVENTDNSEVKKIICKKILRKKFKLRM